MAMFRSRSGGLVRTRWAAAPLARPVRMPADSAIRVQGLDRAVNEVAARTRALLAEELGRGADAWISDARGAWSVDTGHSRARMFGAIDVRGSVIRVRLGNDAEYGRYTPDAFTHVFELGTKHMEAALDAIAAASGRV